MIDPGVASALVVSTASLLVGLATVRNNRAGQHATEAVENKRVELDGKKVDLEVLTESILNLRKDLADEREARRNSDARAEAAEKRAERAEVRVDRLAATLAAHGQWDLLVLAEVRRTNRDFPDPPPLTISDLPD